MLENPLELCINLLTYVDFFAKEKKLGLIINKKQLSIFYTYFMGFDIKYSKFEISIAKRLYFIRYFEN